MLLVAMVDHVYRLHMLWHRRGIHVKLIVVPSRLELTVPMCTHREDGTEACMAVFTVSLSFLDPVDAVFRYRTQQMFKGF